MPPLKCHLISGEISAFPAPLNVGLQDGLDTWLAIDSIGRGRGTEEHHFSREVSQLNFAKEWIILLLILVHCNNAWLHYLLKAHPLALFVLQYSWFFVTLLLFLCGYSFNFNVLGILSNWNSHACSCEASSAVYLLGINIKETFFVRFLFKLTSSGFFIMAGSGTSRTSSSSKDVMQQETFEQSVDQDTPAQGVYFGII